MGDLELLTMELGREVALQLIHRPWSRFRAVDAKIGRHHRWHPPALERRIGPSSLGGLPDPWTST